MAKNPKTSPSILNWMGSLILYAIPGVNLIFLILSIIFAKTSAKRKFAIAALLLMILGFALVVAAFAIFPNELAQIAETMREINGTPTAAQQLLS